MIKPLIDKVSPINFLRLQLILYSLFLIGMNIIWQGPKLDEAYMANAPFNLANFNNYYLSLNKGGHFFDDISFINLPMLQMGLSFAYWLFSFLNPLIVGRGFTTVVFLCTGLVFIQLMQFMDNQNGQSKVKLKSFFLFLFFTNLMLLNQAMSIRAEILVTFFSLTSFYFWNLKKKKFKFLSGLCAAGSFLSHLPGFFIIPSLFLLELINEKWNLKSKKVWFFCIGVAIPLILYSLFIYSHLEAFIEQVVVYLKINRPTNRWLDFFHLVLNIRTTVVFFGLFISMVLMPKIWRQNIPIYIIIGSFVLNLFIITTNHAVYIGIICPFILLLFYNYTRLIKKYIVITLFSLVSILHTIAGVYYLQTINYKSAIQQVVSKIDGQPNEKILAPALFWFNFVNNREFEGFEKYIWDSVAYSKPYYNIPQNKYSFIVLESTLVNRYPDYLNYFADYIVIAKVPFKGISYMKEAVILKRKPF